MPNDDESSGRQGSPVELQPHPAQSRRQSRSVSPAPPIEPSGVASQEPTNEYFEPISQAPTRLSQRSESRLSSVPTSDSRPGTRNSSRRPSIRIRRSSINLNGGPTAGASAEAFPSYDGSQNTESNRRPGRPRSSSQPSPHANNRDSDAGARHPRRPPQAALPRLTEEGSRPTMEELGVNGPPLSPTTSLPGDMNRDRDSSLERESNASQPSRRSRFSIMRWPGNGRRGAQDKTYRQSRQADEYGEELVDLLDTVDPEIQALSTLTNIQNSLFVPDLGNLVNRRPTYNLTQYDAQKAEPPRPDTQSTGEPKTSGVDATPTPAHMPDIPETTAETAHGTGLVGPEPGDAPPMHRSSTITSRITDSHYAALPHGVSLEGWTEKEKWELDDHVRHMLHSRRARFKRTMKGFGQYVRRPLGFFVTLYATLITLFGLAWVLFLIGWIYVGSDDRQQYTIHIIDSVLVALFAIMGDGLAPFRAVDTYHMYFVTKYWRIMEKAKKKRAALEKSDNQGEELSEGKKADRPENTEQNGTTRNPERGQDGEADPVTEDALRGTLVNDEVVDLEDAAAELWPLTPKQRKSFLHHQKKLVKSHSFYKPHETFTHYQFPLKYLLAVIILLDCHSCLQISLGACTWGIDYHHRNVAITTTILCVSITCNISAGLVITRGDHKTRKKDVLKLLDRQELTSDAIKHMEHKKKKEQAKAYAPGKGGPGEMT